LLNSFRLSLFEKVILVNASMLIGEAAVGFWVTSYSPASHHYLIDTLFIVAATVVSLSLTLLLLQASFRPLSRLLATIRAISAGKTQTRVTLLSSDSEIGELAQAFNRMLDRLEQIRSARAILTLQAQEEERRQIALKLYDESSQDLTALLVHAEILQQSLLALPATSLIPDVREQLQSGLGQMAHLTQSTLESLRTLALQLRPAVLDDLGLHAALRFLAEDCRERLHLSVELSLPPPPGSAQRETYPPLYETTLFRVAQESLTNVARHARATHVSMRLRSDEKSVQLYIHDDGRGYEAPQKQAGLGIRGMQERISLLYGTFTLSSHSGKGTTIEASLPLPPPGELPQDRGEAHV
jgi:two-component system sensor histidine kinase UhpB